MMSSTITYDDLEVGFATDFRWLWDDRGSRSDKDGSFFRAENLPGGFYRIGDICTPGYPRAANGDEVAHAGTAVVAIVKDLSGRALARPVRFERVYIDSGAGAERDGALWRMIPPDGYVAMGDVCSSGYDAPALDLYRCVRANLLVTGAIGANLWSDDGSGGDYDGSVWACDAPSPAESEFYFASGSFLASGTRGNDPPNAGRAYCFRGKLTVQQEATRPPAPVLRSLDEPASMEQTTISSFCTLPWYAVRDPGLNAIEKLTSTPTYRLERTDRYEMIRFIRNDGSVPESQTISTTVGFNSSDTKTFSETTAIELSMTYKVGESFSVGVKLTQSFTYGTSSTVGSSTSTTDSIVINCPPRSSVAAYHVHSVFKLFRQSGTQVGNPVACNVAHSLYYTTFPPVAA